MGADLFIKSIQKKREEKYGDLFKKAVADRDHVDIKMFPDVVASLQEKVEFYYRKISGVGYFRDSYNDSSIAWKMGLSWWEGLQLPEGPKLIGDDQMMSPENAALLLEIVSKWVPPSEGEDVKYFQWKRRYMMRFLRLAIRLNESIYCSC